jgi:hypothetical protein
MFKIKAVDATGAEFIKTFSVLATSPELHNHYSLEFNGIDETLNLGSISVTNDLSISAWVKTDSATTQNIITNFNSGVYCYRVQVASDNFRVYVYDGSLTVKKDYISHAIVNDNLWHHLVMTFSNGALILYIDGVAVTYGSLSDNAFTEIAESTGDVIIGGGFVGLIDEVTIWDTQVLSDSDVLTLYNNGVPDYPSVIKSGANLIHHYRMGDDDIGTTITDVVGTNDAEMINMFVSNFNTDIPQ